MFFKIMANAKNLVYFHAPYTGVFFSCIIDLYILLDFFSAAILLSFRHFTVTKALLVIKYALYFFSYQD